MTAAISALGNAPRRELRHLAAREKPRGVNAALAWTSLALSAVVPVLLMLPVGSLVKTLAALAFACLAPGAAAMCHVRLGTSSVSWAISFVLSMSLVALPGAVMLWADVWSPFAALYALAGCSAASALVRLAPTIVGWTPSGRALSARVAAERKPVPAVDSGPKTEVLPAITGPETPSTSTAGSSDATTVLPAVTGQDAPSTSTAGSSDATTVMPALSDLTVVWSSGIMDAAQTGRIGSGAASDLPTGGSTSSGNAESAQLSDATRVIPAIRDASDTIVLRLPKDLAVDEIPKPRDTIDPAVKEETGTAASSTTDAEAAAAIREADDRRARWLTVAEVTILAAAVVSWVVSLELSSTAGVGDYGLLSVMHPTFFVGLCLCVAGFFVEIARRARRTWLLASYIGVLLLIMHATVPVLVHEPEYAWTYKHIGVIQVFRVTGHILNPSDIYQAWPTFFAGVAELGTWSGASTTTIAAWAPLFFDAANCVPLFAIVQSLTTDRRLPYLTVFVFSCVNWIGQDYLSPQAFAYVLCLGTILVMVRWLRRSRGPNGHRWRLIDRVWGRLHDGLEAVPYVGKRSERAALACLYFVYAIVVISHQLSPYLIAASATALVLLGLLRTWQVVPILLGITVTYLLPHYSVVDQYGIFDGINVFHNLFSGVQGTAALSAASSQGEIFSAQAVHLLALLVWGGTVIAILLSRHRLGEVALPAVLAFAPLATLLGQTYGGEAIYRVYLFSAPWCVYLLCRMALRVRRVPRVAGVAGASALVFVGALIGMQGEHGQLTFDQFSRGEVQAVEYLYDNAPAGSNIVQAADNLPARLNQRYVELNYGSDPLVLQQMLPTNRSTITAADLAKIDDYCASLDTGVYVIISKSQIAYAHYFGYLPDGLILSLQRAMQASPSWTVMYRNDDAVIYQLRN